MSCGHFGDEFRSGDPEQVCRVSSIVCSLKGVVPVPVEPTVARVVPVVFTAKVVTNGKACKKSLCTVSHCCRGTDFNIQHLQVPSQKSAYPYCSSNPLFIGRCSFAKKPRCWRNEPLWRVSSWYERSFWGKIKHMIPLAASVAYPFPKVRCVVCTSAAHTGQVAARG